MPVLNSEKELRIQKLYDLFLALIKKSDSLHAIQENEDVINKIIPSDIISLLDKLEKVDIPFEDKKNGMNKFFNVVHKSLMKYPYTEPDSDSFLGCCVNNNKELDKRLTMLRSFVIRFNKQPEDKELISVLRKRVQDIQEYNKYYNIKENVLFPTVEKYWEEFGSLKVMWQFHDEIRVKIHDLLAMLDTEDVNIKEFSQLAENVIFHMRAVSFREERILFPLIERTINNRVLLDLFEETSAIGFPYYQPDIIEADFNESTHKYDLGAGSLTLDQIKALFSNLPVHVTYVNEKDTVVYFNESPYSEMEQDRFVVGTNYFSLEHFVLSDVLKETVSKFRSKELKSTCFWREIEGQKVLAQLFAIYNSGKYSGFVEVDQVITEIQKLEGDRVILDDRCCRCD